MFETKILIITLLQTDFVNPFACLFSCFTLTVNYKINLVIANIRY